MLRRSRSAAKCCLALCAVAAGAAGQKHVTTPSGLLTQAGGGATAFPLTLHTFQVIDDTQRGQVRIFRSIAWRRGITGGGLTAGPESYDLTVTMGHGHLARVGLDPRGNHVGVPTTVFSGSVNRPDWRTAPSVPPAAFDMVVQFQRPFVYTGQSALIWEATCTTPSVYGPGTDSYGHHVASAVGYGFATGCSKGQSTYRLDFRVENDGRPPQPWGMRVIASGNNGPSDGATVLLVGTAPTVFWIPGLCGPLLVDPHVILAHGAVDAYGTLAPMAFSFPSSIAFESSSLVGQLVSLDADRNGLPLSVSQGSKAIMPRSPLPTAAPPCVLVMSRPYPHAWVGIIAFGQAVVARLEHY